MGRQTARQTDIVLELVSSDGSDAAHLHSPGSSGPGPLLPSSSPSALSPLTCMPPGLRSQAHTALGHPFPRAVSCVQCPLGPSRSLPMTSVPTFPRNIPAHAPSSPEPPPFTWALVSQGHPPFLPHNCLSLGLVWSLLTYARTSRRAAPRHLVAGILPSRPRPCRTRSSPSG